MNGWKKAAVQNAASPSGKEVKVSGVVSGWSAWITYNWWFDNILFPGVIAGKGVIAGGFIMFIGTLLNNLAWLVVYERMGMSWVVNTEEAVAGMFKWTKKVMNHKYKFLIVKVIISIIFAIPWVVLSIALWCVARGGVKAFFALSFFTDSFVTTAYLCSKTTCRFGIKAMSLFFASTVVSCAYWTLRSWGLVEVIRFSWKIIQRVIVS